MEEDLIVAKMQEFTCSRQFAIDMLSGRFMTVFDKEKGKVVHYQLWPGEEPHYKSDGECLTFLDLKWQRQ